MVIHFKIIGVGYNFWLKGLYISSLLSTERPGKLVGIFFITYISNFHFIDPTTFQMA